MERELVATSHHGRYTYWIDRNDRYVYQRNGVDGAWLGYLCSEPAWESVFSCGVTIGPYSEYEAANDKATILQSRGWKSLKITPKPTAGGMETPPHHGNWEIAGYAPDRTSAESERCAVLTFSRA